MTNKRSKKIAGIILVNITMAFLISRWLILHVDFNLIINESMNLDKSSIIWSMLLGISLYLFYGLRMALLLDINLKASTQIVIMGFGLNAFLPFRLGDVLKVVISKQFFKIDLSKTTIATFIEKGLDLSVISGLALIFIFGNFTYYIAIVLFFGVLTALYIKLKGRSILKNHHFFVNKFIKLVQLMLAKNKLKFLIFSTICIWSITWLAFYTFFNMNMLSGDTFTVFDAICLLIFTTFSLCIPSMPASIGIFESGIVLYLINNFHFVAEKAVAYAIIFHLIIVLPQIIFTAAILLINVLRSLKLRTALNGI